MAAPKLKAAEDVSDAPPLYGDKPTFTYTPKDGGDPIVWPAHSTIRGEVDGKGYFEMIWEWDVKGTKNADQILELMRRSGATMDMQRRMAKLEDEIPVFLQAWMSADDEPPPGPPPES